MLPLLRQNWPAAEVQLVITTWH